MTRNLLKWRETMLISFSKFFAYRLNFFLTMLAPAFTLF